MPDQEKRPAGSGQISKVLGDATIVVAIVSALAYLVAYKFETAYLGYFGVSNYFVSLTLETLISACSYVVVAIIGLYQLLSPLGILAHRPARKLIHFFRFAIALLVFGSLIYYVFGANWISVGLLTFSVLVFLGQIWYISYRQWKGTSFWEIAKSNGTVRNTTPVKSLDDYIIEKYGFFPFLAVFVFALGLPVAGSVYGRQSAAGQRDFLILEDSYHLVGTKGETGIFVKIEYGKVVGEVMLINISGSEKLKLSRVKYDKGVEGVDTVPRRTSFRDFWTGSVAPLFR